MNDEIKMPTLGENEAVFLSAPAAAFTESVAMPTAGAFITGTDLPNGRPMLPKDETSFFQIALIAGVLWVAFKFAR